MKILDTVKEFYATQGDIGQKFSGVFQVNAAKETSFSDNGQFPSITTVSQSSDDPKLTKDVDVVIQRDNDEISDSFDCDVAKGDLESSIIQKQFTDSEDSKTVQGENADSNHEYGNHDGKKNAQEALHTTSELRLLEIDSQLQVEYKVSKESNAQCLQVWGLLKHIKGIAFLHVTIRIFLKLFL